MQGLLVILLLLACPLSMTVIGLSAWAMARQRGEKRELSVGCVGGHGDHRQSAPDQEPNAALEEQVTRLQLEVESLRARGDGSPGTDGSDSTATPANEKSSGAETDVEQRP